jgi:Bacterial Ig domain
MTMTVRSWLVASLLLTLTIVSHARQVPSATAWTRQGADSGMTKYSSSDLPSVAPTLAYIKRFYGTWAGYTGNYFYANNVIVNAGAAVLFSNDASEGTLKVTKFDWHSGATLAKWAQPYQLGEHDREVDSHHFTNPIMWHSNGKIYSRRGGDNRDQYDFDPSTGAWHQIGIYSPPDTGAWGGDATAFLQTYGNLMVYRWGHVENDGPYSANDITTGQWVQSLGPNVAGDRYRYGDWPKIAQNVHVIAASINSYTAVYLEARQLAPGGGILWSKMYPSDSGGLRGTYSGVSDYWRFVATEEGQYAFFTRSGSPTVRVLDIQTGQEKWNRLLTNNAERPLLAAHGGYLYVIGRAEQLKLDINTGALVWRQTNSFPNDAGYLHQNYEDTNNYTTDIVYRPMVLTDSTLWFVDGAVADSARLVGLKTSDGGILTTIDLAARARHGTETLALVNDMAASDGKLGILVTIRDSADTHPSQIPYQDLYVYDFTGGQPPPPPPQPSPTPPPPGDTTAPTVAITSPAAGSTVAGTVSLTATADDNVGVTSVRFLVDGAVVGTVTSPPYTVTWNTTTVSLTSHTIKATAADAAGNSASATESVTVVAVPPACTTNTPDVSLSPNSTLVTSPGNAVAYTINVRNNDTSGCTTTTFAMGDVVPPGWAASYSAPALDITPGGMKGSSLSLTPPSSSNGVADFTGTALRMNTQGPSGSVSGTVMVVLRLDVSLTIAQANNGTQLIAQVKVGSTALAGVNVTFTILGPTGKTNTLSATTNASGSASVKLQLKGKSNPSGVYQVQVVASGGGLTGSTSGSFITQ